MINDTSLLASAAPIATSRPELPRQITPESTIDDNLVRRFIANDESAFNEIVERYRAKIFTITFSFLRNRADAEEVTQDTFIRAYRGLAKFRGESSLATWLHRIALNLARNRYWYFFRRRRQDAVSLDYVCGADGTASFSDLIADGAADPAQEAVTHEFIAVVERCMAALDQPQREILTQCNTLKRSYAEISLSLGINIGTVKSRIARARERLRIAIAQACPEFGLDPSPGEWILPSRRTLGRILAAA